MLRQAGLMKNANARIQHVSKVLCIIILHSYMLSVYLFAYLRVSIEYTRYWYTHVLANNINLFILPSYIILNIYIIYVYS